jgi:hypothetical protein
MKWCYPPIMVTRAGQLFREALQPALADRAQLRKLLIDRLDPKIEAGIAVIRMPEIDARVVQTDNEASQTGPWGVI